MALINNLSIFVFTNIMMLDNMEEKSVGTGYTAQFIDVMDRLLRETDDYISYQDVYYAHAEKYETDEFKENGRGLMAFSSKQLLYYGYMKKAKLTINNCLKERRMKFDEKIENKKCYFRYPNNLKEDPIAGLKEKNRKLRLKSLENLIQRSSGLVPSSWLTNFQIQTEEEIASLKGEKKKPIIEFDTNNELTNLSLLPDLYYATRDKKVVCFEYKPFGEEKKAIVFHPHYLKEYNSRWFVLGCRTDENGTLLDGRHICALDRVESKVNIKDNIAFVSAPTDYSSYFADIVGVTHTKEHKKEQIVLLTKNIYTHGRIITKPLHVSQKELQPFDEKAKAGKISIEVKPNNELLGLLFSFESNIEVLEPESYKKVFANEVKKLNDIYKQYEEEH